MAELGNPNAMPKLITFLSSILQKVAESNDVKAELKSQKASVFHGVARPLISVERYMERIFKYANCSPSCFVVAYVYLDRFAQRQKSCLPIDSFTVHRLLITSVLVSAKFMDDLYYNNAYYARVGGISRKEMNLMEVEFLFGLGFNLNVSISTFSSYCSCLHREMLLLRPPISSPDLFSLRSHFCFNEDEPSSRPNQQLPLSLSRSFS